MKITMEKEAVDLFRINPTIQGVINLLADMHEENDSCKFNRGEGCMACICQEMLMQILLTPINGHLRG